MSRGQFDKHLSRTISQSRPRLIAAIVRTIHVRRLSVQDVKALYPGFNRQLFHHMKEENREGEVYASLGPVRLLAIAEALDIDVEACMFPKDARAAA